MKIAQEHAVPAASEPALPSAPPPEATEATAGRVALGGFLMGLANLVPGVSGGTMILAMGLYDRFIGAVSNLTRLKLDRSTLVFCALVGVGLTVAILGLSGVFVWLVREHRWVAYSLFVGMTLGGVPALLALTRPLRAPEAVAFLVGLAVMLGLAYGLRDSALAPTTGVLIAVGAAASASMILPGISGSYILLILGLYDVVWSAVRPDALRGDPAGSLAILVPIGVGVVLGIGLLSNVLRILLTRTPRPTHAALLGLLLGSIVGLWPFQRAEHPLLGTKPGVEAVQLVLAGAEPAQILAETEVALSEADRAEALTRYAGASRGDLKRLGLELVTFTPTAAQVALALALLVTGFVLTRKLGIEDQVEREVPRRNR